jgi:hypothetical protein
VQGCDTREDEWSSVAGYIMNKKGVLTSGEWVDARIVKGGNAVVDIREFVGGSEVFIDM